MRLIGELDDPRLAERFSAYLVTCGIPANAERNKGDSKSEIWVHEEDHIKQAQSELAEFLSNPNDVKYAQALPQAQRIIRHQEDKRKRIQKKIVAGKRALEPKPQVTVCLIGICIGVGLFTNLGAARHSPLFKALAFTAVPPPLSAEIVKQANGNRDDLSFRLASLRRGEVWRMITPIFIHHGVMHLLFNMIWLYQLGKAIEFRYGKVYFLILVLLGAAIPLLVQCTMPERLGGSAPGLLPMRDGTSNGTLLNGVGGFSGVIYALFGLIWVKSVLDPASRFVLPQSTVTIMLVWLVFCMLPGTEGQPLTQQIFGFSAANWAHAFGLLVGICLAFVPEWKRKKKRNQPLAAVK